MYAGTYGKKNRARWKMSRIRITKRDTASGMQAFGQKRFEQGHKAGIAAATAHVAEKVDKLVRQVEQLREINMELSKRLNIVGSLKLNAIEAPVLPYYRDCTWAKEHLLIVNKHLLMEKLPLRATHRVFFLEMHETLADTYNIVSFDEQGLKLINTYALVKDKPNTVVTNAYEQNRIAEAARLNSFRQHREDLMNRVAAMLRSYNCSVSITNVDAGRSSMQVAVNYVDGPPGSSDQRAERLSNWLRDFEDDPEGFEDTVLRPWEIVQMTDRVGDIPAPGEEPEPRPGPRLDVHEVSVSETEEKDSPRLSRLMQIVESMIHRI